MQGRYLNPLATVLTALGTTVLTDHCEYTHPDDAVNKKGSSLQAMVLMYSVGPQGKNLDGRVWLLRQLQGQIHFASADRDIQAIW